MTDLGSTGEFHVVPDVSAVADGLWVVRIPLHVRVEPANAYIGRSDDGGLVVFDTGLAVGAAALWTAAFEQVGHTAADVVQVVVSHHHPDHIGGTAALHALTGLPIHASRSTIDQAPGVWGDEGRLEQYFTEMHAHYRRHGVPAQVVDDLEGERLLARNGVQLAPDDAWVPLDAGAQLRFAGSDWTVHDTPGHADGHIILHDAAGSRMLSADHLLERISPAVGRFPRHAADPLANYLASLSEVACLDPQLVLPGHGEPFRGGADRAHALVRHHDARVLDCVGAVRELVEGGRGAGGATAYDAASLAFSRVFARPDASATDRRFATTETLAHLEHARLGAGHVTCTEDDAGVVRYRPA